MHWEDFICKLVVESVCILECASAALSGEWVFFLKAWGWVVLHESGSTSPG